MHYCKICKCLLDTAAGLQCPRCRTIHCPVCGAPTHVFIAERRTLCQHVIAMACPDECDEDAGGWEQSPFVRWNLAVPKAPEGLYWTDMHRLVEAFDILLPLLNAYERDGVDTVQLFDLLLEEIVVPVKRVRWRLAGTGIAPANESSGTDYFTVDPDEVRQQVMVLIGRLKAGFDQFAPQ